MKLKIFKSVRDTLGLPATARVRRAVVLLFALCLIIMLSSEVTLANTAPGSGYWWSSSFGSFGNGDGQFQAPAGIAVDTSGNMYVADDTRNVIEKFNQEGGYVTKIGSGDLSFPEGVAVDSSGNVVYVADTMHGSIKEYSSKDNGRTYVYKTTLGYGQLKNPYGVAVDQNGNIYVADVGNFRIQKFNPDGSIAPGWDTFSPTVAGAEREGVAVDASGYVYASDTTHNRVDKLTPNGTLRAQMGVTDGKLYYPRGVAIDSRGMVYVDDQRHDRIQAYSSSDGMHYAPAGTWGSIGSSDGQLQSPEGVAVDRFGFIDVADTENGRVERFKYFQNPFSVGTGNLQIVRPFQNMMISFDSVTAAGNMEADPTDPIDPAPVGYAFLPGTSFNIMTDATYDTTNGKYIYATIPYDPNQVPAGQENSLKIMHYEGSGWIDRTYSQDTTNHTITARTTSLSPFVIVYPSGSVPASSNWSLGLIVLFGIVLLAKRSMMAREI